MADPSEDFPSRFERIRRLVEEYERTLVEGSQDLDVVRERIRQIEAKALRQLRSPERARHLRALLAAR